MISIVDGIVKNKTIDGIPVAVNLIPETQVNSRSGLYLSPASITVHNTGNNDDNADAIMHSLYIQSTDKAKSWHFVVDDKVIVQNLPVNEVAWHAGDGKHGEGNRTSLSIEICEIGDYKKAEENAIILIRGLKENLGINDVFSHKKWSGKNCPRLILKSGWDDFLSRIDNEVPEWKLRGLKALHRRGIVSDYDHWAKHLEEPLPAWAVFEILSKLS